MWVYVLWNSTSVSNFRCHVIQVSSSLLADGYLLSDLLAGLQVDVHVQDGLFVLSLAEDFAPGVHHGRVSPGDVVSSCVAGTTNSSHEDLPS